MRMCMYLRGSRHVEVHVRVRGVCMIYTDLLVYVSAPPPKSYIKYRSDADGRAEVPRSQRGACCVTTSCGPRAPETRVLRREGWPSSGATPPAHPHEAHPMAPNQSCAQYSGAKPKVKVVAVCTALLPASTRQRRTADPNRLRVPPRWPPQTLRAAPRARC